MRRLPTQLRPIGIPIREGQPHGRLGHWDPKKGEIVINPRQPWVGKNTTLLHEILHAVDDAMIQAGITKRRIPHKWIESGAMNLLLVLACSGLWRGVSPRQMRRFYREQFGR